MCTPTNMKAKKAQAQSSCQLETMALTMEAAKLGTSASSVLGKKQEYPSYGVERPYIMIALGLAHARH